MVKGMIKIGACVIVAVFLASCTMRTYVLEKKRVDQEISGNAGCLSGACQPADTSNVRKTRKTYVWEIESGPAKVVTDEPSAAVTYESSYNEEAYETEEPAMPYVGRETYEPAEQAATFVDYKIESGDTLQKISKKFYNTYSKWNKIYEANTDVLSSPDRIVPGKVIRIPQ